MIINGFNIAAERVNLLIALTMLYMTVATKPRRTTGLSVVFYGQVLSVINIILHMACIWFIDFSTATGGFIFRITVLLFYATYLGILVLLFTYIHLLSLKQRENLDTLNLAVIAFSAVYIIVVLCIFLTDSYITVVDDQYRFTSLFYINIAFALADVVLVICSAVANRKGIPRVLIKLLYMFVPFETIVLIIQLIQPQFVILSVTYVVPFMLCYIIFHSNIYDEITGCQNKQAFESHIALSKKAKAKNSYVYIMFPRFRNADSVELLETAKKRISTKIRMLEQINSDARVYEMNVYTYAIILPEESDEDVNKTIVTIKKMLDEAMEEWEYSNRPEYKMVVIGGQIRIEDAMQLDVFSNFLFEKSKVDYVNYYEGTAEDFEICIEQKEIEHIIIDIRNKGNLNDPRVIAYVQPIYDVIHDKYSNAEALMRLDVNGKVISPDIFIPLAERVGCIHTLTRIILNKVCYAIYEMQDYYNFEAVSVNVSLTEFMDYCLHDELIEIIKRNGIPCSKIRLEMTETMTSDEIEAINHNMEEFNNAGVHFYLDDFGTGYSNLERIVSLPFKTIKFDKSLLYKSMDDPILLQLIQNMVDVFKSHGLIVLVEGVENQTQAKLSKKIGFEYIQGYNYAAPVPIAKLPEFFEAKRNEMKGCFYQNKRGKVMDRV